MGGRRAQSGVLLELQRSNTLLFQCVLNPNTLPIKSEDFRPRSFLLRRAQKDSWNTPTFDDICFRKIILPPSRSETDFWMKYPLPKCWRQFESKSQKVPGFEAESRQVIKPFWLHLPQFEALGSGYLQPRLVLSLTRDQAASLESCQWGVVFY